MGNFNISMRINNFKSNIILSNTEKMFSYKHTSQQYVLTARFNSLSRLILIISDYNESFFPKDLCSFRTQFQDTLISNNQNPSSSVLILLNPTT